MVAPLLVTLREGLEASLILGIVLAYLVRTGHAARAGQVWAGTLAAVVVSLLVGAGVFITVGDLDGTAEQLFEGTAMLLAVGMLTYMVVWMKRQSRGIAADLHEKVRSALQSGSGAALALMAFLVVLREGLETALFFFAATRSSTPVESVSGGLIGLALAAALGYSIYRGSRALNLKTFFNVTGVMLVVFAAGMLGHGVHEFQGAGILPGVVEHIWDTASIVDDESTFGRFLVGLFGYSSDPSLVEVASYVGYLLVSLAYFFRLPALSTPAQRRNSGGIA